MSLFTRDREVATDEERTVALARRQFSRRQWARRWLAWRRLVVVLAVLALVAGSLWLVFASSALGVSGVRVDGTHVLDPRTVRRAAAVPTGTPLATVDLDAVARRVEQLPAVAAVDVSRSWPDAVRVSVTERTAVAVVARGGRLRGMDEEGVLFRRFPSRPRSLPLVRTAGAADQDALREAARVAGSLPAAIARRVDFVQVSSVDRISQQLRSGRVVRWGSADESAAKAEVLEVLLRQKAQRYDVSVPGQPIIKK